MTDEVDLDRRFAGIKHLYGDNALENFQRAHICVIGIGGVGSWAVEALARSAIGKLTLIDLDNIAESNVNRQIHALSGEFGRAKVEVMRERVGLINPACEVDIIEDFVTRDNLADMLRGRGYDFVIDCIDDFRIKAAIIYWCRRNKIRIVTVGGAGGQIDPTLISIADLSNTVHDPLMSRVRKQLRQEYAFTSNSKRRFNIPCVYSSEQMVFPDNQGNVCQKRNPDSAADGLSCAGGIGSATAVTGSFAFVAVSLVLKKLASKKPAA